MNPYTRTAGIIIALVLLAGIVSADTAIVGLAVDQGPAPSILITSPDGTPLDGAAWLPLYESINDAASVRSYMHQGFTYFYQGTDGKGPTEILNPGMIPLIAQGGAAPTITEQEAVVSLNGPGEPVEWYSLAATIRSYFW